MGRIEVRGDTSRETQIDGYATPPPLRKAKGDASAASRGMPVIHPNTPHVIPASPRHSRGRGNPEKSKARHFHPNNQHSLHRNPPTATTCPPPPSLREGGRERSEQGDARNSPQYPRHVIPADAGTQRKTKHAIPNTPPQKPNHQPVSQFVPQFETKPCTSTYMVLPNCTSHFYLTSTAMLY